MHARAVARAVGLVGERKAAFYEWAREHPGKLQEAVQKQVQLRDVSGWVALSKAFHRDQPGDLSTWTIAGFETRMGSDGEHHARHGSGDWVMAKDLGQ